MNRPGVRLRRIAARWCRPETMERLLEPVLADLQAEYEHAVRDGRPWRSRGIWILGHIAFIKVVLWHGSRCAIGGLRGLTGEDRRTLIRILGVCVAITFLAMALLAGVPFSKYHQAGHPGLGMYEIPQALPISIPLGLVLGILCGVGKAAVSRSSRRIVLLVAFVGSTGSFVTLGWIIPATNHASRIAVAGHQVPKTTSDLSLGELGRRLSGPRPSLSDRGIVRLTMDYQARWALACSPFLFSLFAVLLAGRVERGRVVLGLAGCAATVVYYTILTWARGLALDGAIPALAAAWAPNAVLSVWL